MFMFHKIEKHTYFLVGLGVVVLGFSGISAMGKKKIFIQCPLHSHRVWTPGNRDGGGTSAASDSFA